jgi:alpha-tubulin suppressor-like RCC1 family protein
MGCFKMKKCIIILVKIMNTSKTIFSGLFHTAALTSEGKIVCWGFNNHGQCDVPENLENVISIKCGDYHTTALTSEGKVVCWGRNNYRQCDVPKDLENVISIGCGNYHTIALTLEKK